MPFERGVNAGATIKASFALDLTSQHSFADTIPTLTAATSTELSWANLPLVREVIPTHSRNAASMTFEQFIDKYQRVPVEEYPNQVSQSVPEPTVSVLVNTYQHVSFIRQCLDSILSQEVLFAFEILVSDDESTDGTREICIEYAKQYPDRIRLFLHSRQNNIPILEKPTGKFQGIYARFMARGKYLAFCEGDDYWIHPRKLALQVQLLDANPTYSMCGGRSETLRNSESSISGILAPPFVKDSYSFEDLFESYFVHLSTYCVRRELDRVPHWGMDLLGGDAIILANCADKGPVGYVHESLSVYRHHEHGGWTGASAERKFREARKFAEAINRQFQDKYHEIMQVYLFKHLDLIYQGLVGRNEFARVRKLLMEAHACFRHPYIWRILAMWLRTFPFALKCAVGKLRVSLAVRTRLRRTFTRSSQNSSLSRRS